MGNGNKKARNVKFTPETWKLNWEVDLAPLPHNWEVGNQDPLVSHPPCASSSMRGDGDLQPMPRNEATLQMSPHHWS